MWAKYSGLSLGMFLVGIGMCFFVPPIEGPIVGIVVVGLSLVSLAFWEEKLIKAAKARANEQTTRPAAATA